MERLIPPASIPTKTLHIVEPQHKPRYTLDDLRELAREYADERHCEARLTVQLSLGCFVEWLAKREQEKGGGS